MMQSSEVPAVIENTFPISSYEFINAEKSPFHLSI